jgi:hypothetical protein
MIFVEKYLGIPKKRPDWTKAWESIQPEGNIVLHSEPTGGTGPYSLQEVFKWMYFSWEKATSSDPQNWTLENPAWGQCAITTMMLHKFFRDQEPCEIWNCRAHLPDGRSISHYALALLESEQVLDFTKIQFPKETHYSPWSLKLGYEETAWSYVTMAHENTRRRFDTFYDNVHLWLAQEIDGKLFHR